MIAILAVALAILAAPARAQNFLDATGLPDSIDPSVGNESSWYRTYAEKDYVCVVKWEIVATKYNMFTECRGKAVARESGALRMEGGKFGLESETGRHETGTYEFLPDDPKITAPDPLGGTTQVRAMYVWGSGPGAVWTSQKIMDADKLYAAPLNPATVAVTLDPAVVGDWVGHGVSGAGVEFRCLIRISPDGAYTWLFRHGKTSFTQRGSIEAQDGAWTTHPAGERKDFGGYAVSKDKRQRARLNLSEAPDALKHFGSLVLLRPKDVLANPKITDQKLRDLATEAR